MASSKVYKHPELVKGLSTANANFARDLYKVLADSSLEDNLFMSPYSILTVMSLALLGAKDKTASEMLSALKLSAISANLQEVFEDYISLLLTPLSGYDISTANKLFVRKGKMLCDEFIAKSLSFRAKADLCDFVGNREAECSKINSWVAKETREKIQNVVSPLVLSDDTCMLIVNAIYFKGTWMNMFDPVCTRRDQFTVSPSKQVNVDMMNLTDTFGFQKLDDLKCSALEIPYKSNFLSMVVLLPFDNNGLGSLEKGLTSTHLNLNFPRMEVNVSMPRFKMESDFELTDVLKSLGIKTAFDPMNADFSGIDPSGLLSLSNVIHKSFVEVNEYGTEAAAATVMDCVDGMSSRDEIYFKADHPFLFLIKDNRSGMILFLGRLVNPQGLEIPQPRTDWNVMDDF